MAAGVNSFSVGKDISVTVVANGATLSIAGKTAAEFKPMYSERVSHGLDGIVRFMPIPAGWEGTIEFDRKDSGVETFFATVESGYYSGAGISAGTVTQTITNPDGSISSFLYSGAMFTLREAGNWKGDDKVTMRIDMKASTRTALL